MRPDARIAAAIEILDDILAGAPAERCLTTWGRRHRFAGSGDRGAIRDLVFDALRRKRSLGWLGGGSNGRALMIGAARAADKSLDALFTGAEYGPPVLSTAEREAGRRIGDAPEAVRLDCPDALWPELKAAYGEEAEAILTAMQDRAPVFLRVNRMKGTREDAVTLLGSEDVTAQAHPLSDSALEVTENARWIQNTRAYRKGYVELQDAASQAVVDQCRAYFGAGEVLDYCAGGGGKALAMAAAGASTVAAHDAEPRRMADIPARAARAGVGINVVTDVNGQFDLVLCDAPCSGSGAWRRQPDAKWRLDDAGLAALTRIQDDILDRAVRFVRPGGTLAYATCSLLPIENMARATGFLSRHPEWHMVRDRQWTPLDGGDGFFLACFQRS
ncbi:MAG: RsmB/NOP family class I SAM-dependent RNA methyltransferase [Pseudomonadota bacterium]